MNAFLKAFLVSLAFLFIVFAGIHLVLKETKTPPDYSSEESQEYYRDSFTLLAHDANGIPILIDMDFNRKEKDGRFIHYYSGTIWYGNSEGEDFSTQFYSEESSVEAHDYLKDYLNERFPDLSSRETHQVTFSSDLGDIEFELTTEGDFLTKNTLDYTRFSSVVETTLVVDHQGMDAQVLWEEVYSSDYSKAIFFEGRDELASETILFTLWDTEGNFYHIDQSVVENELEDYASHTWILHKDATTNSMQKSFDAIITPDREEIKIELPEWTRSISLTTPLKWNGANESGRIGGTIQTEAGETQKIEGFFKHVVY